MKVPELTFDWNTQLKTKMPVVEIFDETLRDGLQSPSITEPTLEQKFELISMMNDLGIASADVGLPASSPKAFQDVFEIAKFVRDQGLKIELSCAGRTLENDILPMAKIQQQTGVSIMAYCFLGISPIRQLVEDWDLDKIKKTAEDAINFAHKENLQVAFVTEDTTRSLPSTLEVLFNHVIGLGVRRLVLCDTVGHATPDGVKALVDFTKDLIKASKEDVKIDWHGHNDRGLALSNSLFAAQNGCHRLHGTALGIGERVGNAPVDQLLVNLKLLGAYEGDLTALGAYVEKASLYTKGPKPFNYPIFGNDAFRTATGVHAAAVIKAQEKGEDLADIIYSGVPASWFGKKQQIEVGPMSGASNVRYWLKEQGILATDALVQKILEFAKKQHTVLSFEQLKTLVKKGT
jgi:2-isopropylmalate synthase